MTDGTEKTYNTRSNAFDIVVKTYGNARGLKDQFAKSDPTQLDPIITRLHQSGSFATGYLADTVGTLRSRLADAWQGKSADQALAIIDMLQTDAQSIGANTSTVARCLEEFQHTWVSVRNAAANLDDDDDDGAHRLFDQFTTAQDDAMHGMPNYLNYHTPLSGSGDAVPNPVVPSGSNSDFGSGGGVHIPTLGTPTFSSPHIGGTSMSPGSFGGGAGLGGVGAGDPSSQLAGLGGGVGTGAGLGAGTGAGGLGAGDGGAGLGAGAGAGAGAGGAGAGSPGAGGMGGAPMGGGGGQNKQEHERETWLAEDEDVWGGSDAPGSIIT